MKKQIKKQVIRKIDSSSDKHETPSTSTAGACYTFICENEHFLLWSKVIKLRYWIYLGSTEKCDVSWVNSRNKSGAILKSLIRVMPDLQQSDNNCNALLFALTLFNTNRKIMIQGNHRELWVERKFSLSKDLVSETSQGKDLMMLCKEATGTSMVHVSFDDLDESDSEDNDQTDPDPNSAENQVRRSSGPMINESIRLFDDEDFGDDDSDKVSFDKLDLKTFTPKSRKGQPGKKQKKADKKKVQFKPKNISVFDLDSRIKAMEDFASKIDSVIGGKLTEIVMQEELIDNIVKVKIEEELKDLKIKHKNSVLTQIMNLTRVVNIHHLG